VLETGLFILAQECDPQSAGLELKDGFRRSTANLGELGRKIGLVQPGVALANDLAFIIALEALKRVLAGLIIRGDQIDGLVAELVGELAGGLVQRVVLPRPRNNWRCIPCRQRSTVRRWG